MATHSIRLAQTSYYDILEIQHLRLPLRFDLHLFHEAPYEGDKVRFVVREGDEFYSTIEMIDHITGTALALDAVMGPAWEQNGW